MKPRTKAPVVLRTKALTALTALRDRNPNQTRARAPKASKDLVSRVKDPVIRHKVLKTSKAKAQLVPRIKAQLVPRIKA